MRTIALIFVCLLQLLSFVVNTHADPVAYAVCQATCAATCGLAGVAITPAGSVGCYAACQTACATTVIMPIP